MGQSSDQIRQEIDQTRQDAADKIDQLKEQVEGTTAQMRTQVQDTAGQVLDQAKATVDETSGTVKENIDLRQQIEERPLVALGAALVGGFLLGGMVGGDKSRSGSQQHPYSSGTPVGESMSGGGAVSGIRGAIQRSGFEDTLSSAAAALMGSLTEQVRDTLDRNFPGFAEKMSTAQHQSGSLSDKTRATTTST